MKAIILAAGFGTRLKPMTDKLPKCMVPIGGEPLISIWLSKLHKLGVSDVLVNTHYLSQIVSSYLENSKFKSFVKVVYEEKLLGTAGTLLKNIEFFDGEDGLLIHGDNFCVDGLEGFISAHKNRPSECQLTALSFKSEHPKSCGIFELNEKKVVINFYEKKENPPGNIANGAVYMLSREFIYSYQDKFRSAIDFSLDVMPNLKNKIYVFETNDFFIYIGTIESYKNANQYLLKLA